MLVQRILASKDGGAVVTIAPGVSVGEASKMLSEKKIGALIVSSDGETPLGILSERDIVRELGRRGGSCLDLPVDDLMTRNLVSCTASETTDQVLTKMTDGRFRHMPVTDHDGNVLGLITIGDVVNFRLTELEHEALQLKQLIVG